VDITGANAREVDRRGVKEYAQNLLGMRAVVLAGRVRGPGTPHTRAAPGPAALEDTYVLEVEILQEPLRLDEDWVWVGEDCAGSGFDCRKSFVVVAPDGSAPRITWTSGIWPPLSNQTGFMGEVKFSYEVWRLEMDRPFALQYPDARDAARAILGDSAGVLTACYLMKTTSTTLVRIRVEATSMPPIRVPTMDTVLVSWGCGVKPKLGKELRDGEVHVKYDIANTCVIEQSHTKTFIQGVFVRAWELEQRPPVRRQRHRGRGKGRSGSTRRRGRGPWCVIRVQPGGADAVALQPPLELEPSRRRKRLHRPSRERAVD
jgi:hypothetical protein